MYHSTSFMFQALLILFFSKKPNLAQQITKQARKKSHVHKNTRHLKKEGRSESQQKKESKKKEGRKTRKYHILSFIQSNRVSFFLILKTREKNTHIIFFFFPFKTFYHTTHRTFSSFLVLYIFFHSVRFVTRKPKIIIKIKHFFPLLVFSSKCKAIPRAKYEMKYYKNNNTKGSYHQKIYRDFLCHEKNKWGKGLYYDRYNDKKGIPYIFFRCCCV